MGRRRTPREKLEIINLVKTGTLSVSKACRQQGISPRVFYQWQREFKEAGLEGLKPGTNKTAAQKVEELEAEVLRLKSLIAEIAEENFKLKKGQWP